MTRTSAPPPSHQANWWRRQWALYPVRNIQIAIAIVALALFASPVIAVVISAFRTTPFNGEWSLEPITQVFSDSDTWVALGNSVLLTVASVIPSMIIATFFAVLVTRTDSPLKWVVTITMAILVATPPMFYAVAWGLLGNSTVGILNVILRGGEPWGSGPLNVESWLGLILVSIFRGTGFMYLLLLGPFSQMDRSLEEAARVSGAGAIRTFFGTQLPLLLPTLTSVLIIATVASIEAFDVPVVLGVPAGIYVLPTEVFTYLYDSTRPLYGQASSVAVILLLILIALLIVERRLHGRRRFTTVSGKGARTALWKLGAWRMPIAITIIVFSLVVVIMPTLQLVLTSLAPYFGAQGVFTLDNFATVLGDPAIIGILAYTASVAAAAAAIAVVAVIVFGWATRMRRGPLATVIDTSQVAPMIVPGLLLGIGLITVVLFTPLASAYGTYWLLMVALFIAIVPLASRAVAGALAQIPEELEEAARVSGSSRGRALVGVVFRLLLPSALNGWLLCFVVVSGSLAVPLLLSPRGQTLLAVKVYDLYTSANVVTAAAIFVLFVVEILVITLLVEIAKRLLTRARLPRRLPSADVDRDWTGATRVALPPHDSKSALAPAAPRGQTSTHTR
ncbi:ABC transporter permease [Microbacterium faecale]|uniref:ABC transporter permease n=1 Tax=Microbacterium faecale TaxID=1804630 RepID=A0A916Y2E2_9MICO|nr:ABC transporter permease subunit [Microbacterium faecale]GGD26832.1 ABC transporter permease [Microbacterium faecale]